MSCLLVPIDSDRASLLDNLGQDVLRSAVSNLYLAGRAVRGGQRGRRAEGRCHDNKRTYHKVAAQLPQAYTKITEALEKKASPWRARLKKPSAAVQREEKRESERRKRERERVTSD